MTTREYEFYGTPEQCLNCKSWLVYTERNDGPGTYNCLKCDFVMKYGDCMCDWFKCTWTAKDGSKYEVNHPQTPWEEKIRWIRTVISNGDKMKTDNKDKIAETMEEIGYLLNETDLSPTEALSVLTSLTIAVAKEIGQLDEWFNETKKIVAKATLNEKN